MEGRGRRGGSSGTAAGQRCRGDCHWSGARLFQASTIVARQVPPGQSCHLCPSDHPIHPIFTLCHAVLRLAVRALPLDLLCEELRVKGSEASSLLLRRSRAPVGQMVRFVVSSSAPYPPSIPPPPRPPTTPAKGRRQPTVPVASPGLPRAVRVVDISGGSFRCRVWRLVRARPPAVLDNIGPDGVVTLVALLVTLVTWVRTGGGKIRCRMVCVVRLVPSLRCPSRDPPAGHRASSPPARRPVRVVVGEI